VVATHENLLLTDKYGASKNVEYGSVDFERTIHGFIIVTTEKDQQLVTKPVYLFLRDVDVNGDGPDLTGGLCQRGISGGKRVTSEEQKRTALRRVPGTLKGDRNWERRIPRDIWGCGSKAPMVHLRGGVCRNLVKSPSVNIRKKNQCGKGMLGNSSQGGGSLFSSLLAH